MKDHGASTLLIRSRCFTRMMPVKSGARVRGRFMLKEVTERVGKRVQFRYGVSVEIEGASKPALMADWLALAVLK